MKQVVGYIFLFLVFTLPLCPILGQTGSDFEIIPVDSPVVDTSFVTQMDSVPKISRFQMKIDSLRREYQGLNSKKYKRKQEREKRKQMEDGMIYEMDEEKYGQLNPNKAWHKSAVIPGWGQVYNHSAWKVPIIYAGFGTMTGFFIFNHTNYKNSRQDHIDCLNDPDCDGIDESNFINSRDFYRRNRDLTVVVGVLWYTLNLLDAYIEAHMKEFDISDDLSMKIYPNGFYLPKQNEVYLGLSLSIGMK